MATSAPAARPTTRDPRPSAVQLDYRPSYLAATIASVAVFALYLLTLAPSTAMWDTSEYIAAAYTLGLPHPPGNPLFVLLGRVFAVLPLPGNVAVRINVLAALSSAVSAGMWFLITERVLVSWFPARWQRIVGGAIATLIGATAFTVWNQSVVNEKVYTVSLVGIAIISWLMIRWSDEPDGRQADRILVLVAYLLGLGFANHMGGMLAAPAAALAVVVRRPWTALAHAALFAQIILTYLVAKMTVGSAGTIAGAVLAVVLLGGTIAAALVLSPRGERGATATGSRQFRSRYLVALAGAGALFLGLTPFATQPIRAAHFPPINEGEPTACRVELTASCTFSKATYDAFMYNFNRGQYGKPKVNERQACPAGVEPPCGFADAIGAQIGMWWYYFKWQWLRDAHSQNPGLQSILAAIFLVLGLVGGWVHWRRDRQSFWYFGSLMFTMTLLLIYYLNFKYGNTQSPELGDQVPREVRDRDYFFLWSFSAWGVWAGLGLVYLWETLAAVVGADRVQLGREVVEVPRRRSLLVAAPVLAIALIPLITNASIASRAGETDTRDFAHDLLNSVEPYGILVTVGDNDTFPLWYAQEVEGIRKDVIVANTSLLNTDWYVRQLIRRPVFEYDEARGPAIYRGGSWKKPIGAPLQMTLDQADSVPAYSVLNRTMVFRKGEITATIDPRLLIPAGDGAGLLQRADIFVLYMLRDAYPARPIYFSRTSGGYARQLGLEEYTITQGLASKVFVPPKAPGRDTLFVQGDGWFDVRRTEALWKNVFLGPQAIIEKGDWIDRPSVGIPYLYVATGLALAEALRSTGRPQDAQGVLSVARQVAAAVRLEQLLAATEQGLQMPSFPSGDSNPGRQLPAQTP